MANKVDLMKVLQWVIGTVMTAAGTVFTIMHFAYSDFDTQRTENVYREQMDKRLEQLQKDVNRIDNKLDRLLLKRAIDE